MDRMPSEILLRVFDLVSESEFDFDPNSKFISKPCLHQSAKHKRQVSKANLRLKRSMVPLSQACSNWRHFFTSNKILWVITVSSTGGNTSHSSDKDKLDAISQHLKHALECPDGSDIDIELHPIFCIRADEWQWKTSHQLATWLEQNIFSLRQRIRCLSLHLGDCVAKLIPSLQDGFDAKKWPRLRRLSIMATTCSVVQNYDTHPLQFPLHRMILSHMRELELSFGTISTLGHWDFLLFPHLHSLVLKTSTYEALAQLLRCFRTKALRRLQVTCYYFKSPAAVEDLENGLGTIELWDSVASLQFSGIQELYARIPAPCLSHFFTNQPALREVYHLDIHVGDVTWGQTGQFVVVQGQKISFPNLRTLTLTLLFPRVRDFISLFDFSAASEHVLLYIPETLDPPNRSNQIRFSAKLENLTIGCGCRLPFEWATFYSIRCIHFEDYLLLLQAIECIRRYEQTAACMAVEIITIGGSVGIYRARGVKRVY